MLDVADERDSVNQQIAAFADYIAQQQERIAELERAGRPTHGEAVTLNLLTQALHSRLRYRQMLQEVSLAPKPHGTTREAA